MVTKPVADTTIVEGNAEFANILSYPAPSGEEDDELYRGEHGRIDGILPGESTNFKRENGSQSGNWWFAQVVGNDPASGGYHFEDGTYPEQGSDGKTYQHGYGDAFDIDLKAAPTFKTNGSGLKWPAFYNYVEALRNAGIACWHRWAGEPGSTENEIHCIDPNTPNIKSQLYNQLFEFPWGYRYGGQGSRGYEKDWPILGTQIAAMVKCFNSAHGTHIQFNPGTYSPP
jgi:hypothetical protein